MKYLLFKGWKREWALRLFKTQNDAASKVLVSPHSVFPDNIRSSSSDTMDDTYCHPDLTAFQIFFSTEPRQHYKYCDKTNHRTSHIVVTIKQNYKNSHRTIHIAEKPTQNNTYFGKTLNK